MAAMVPRLYGGFRGVDFRGEEIDLTRSPDSVNMWKDYKETESIRTRPGLELRKWFDSPVYGIFFFNSELLVHSGNALYRVVGSDAFLLYSNLAASRSDSFAWGDKWYFKDGKSYLVYDGSEVKPVEGYIPTTTIARKPSGGGTPLEDVNMLSRFRKNSFLAD